MTESMLHSSCTNWHIHLPILTSIFLCHCLFSCFKTSLLPAHSTSSSTSFHPQNFMLRYHGLNGSTGTFVAYISVRSQYSFGTSYLRNGNRNMSSAYVPLASSGYSSRSSTVIGNDDFRDDPTHSLVSTFGIPTDLAVSSVNAPSHLPLGPRQPLGSRLSSNTSRRHHLVPRAKCPKSPLPRKIGYYQV